MAPKAWRTPEEGINTEVKRFSMEELHIMVEKGELNQDQVDFFS